MKCKKGFIAIPLVLSIILFATAILFFLFMRFSNNNYFITNIEKDIKQRLANSKTPNCFWGSAPIMRIYCPSGRCSDPVSAAIILSCNHVDLISNSFLLADENYFEVYDNENNLTNNLVINSLVRISPDGIGGYRVFLEIASSTPGSYYISLKKGKVCTYDKFCNDVVNSEEIVVEIT